MSDHLVLISGSSATGKSASLRDIKDQEGVIYLNCESGKKLPFKNKFKKMVVTDPMQVPAAFDQAEQMPEIHTIVIDTLTFLMDMYESNYVLGSSNTMAGWSNYAQFFKSLMQQKVATSTKTIIILAHTSLKLNESDPNNMVLECKVPVKGALQNQGIEAYFSTVISTKKVEIKTLKEFSNPYLTITPEEEELGFKYVYQCNPTKETKNERIRAPMGMFDRQHTYIDNNAQYLITILNDYYED